MKIVEIKQIIPVLLQQLLEIWENSVRGTHLFLSDDEIKSIKKYVPQALKEISHLVIVENESKIPIAFMGNNGQKLEMLFVSNEQRGKGIGKRLIEYGIEIYSINKLTVNEQNPLAKDFYEHMGFQVYKKSNYDEQGNPYSLLYMKQI
ncbi:MAG: GNAT family N-acetyltransferase [Firmicutes bacterium]|jgi:putative acetyltransferase|nr:GNAT family N-acetyltransferase [Bacillota bacterium]